MSSIPSWPHAGATFSPCGRYRYLLWRAWDDRPRVLFVSLNPSKAGADDDDNTSRRYTSFARRWGFGGWFGANLYALISTDPKALRGAGPSAVGPLNDWILLRLATTDGPIVVGWGRHGEDAQVGRVGKVMSLLPPAHVRCLGKNKDGSPEHPLYVPTARELRPWP